MKNNAIKQLIRVVGKMINKGMESVGRYYSTYRGIVVDNKDPEGLQRLKIAVPEIYGNQTFTEWVYPASVFSGKGYGVQAIPQKDDLISVSFEYGNPRRPRWNYGYFAKVGKNKEHEITDEDLRDPKKFWFKTPGGLLILLDDKEEAEEDKSINLIHPSGLSFRINGNSIDMVVPGGKKINMGEFDEAAEFIIKGETHLDHIKTLHDALTRLTVGTAFGPSTTPINLVEFQTNKEYLDLGLSDKVKTD